MEDCLGLDVTGDERLRDTRVETYGSPGCEGHGVEISIDDFGTIYSSLSYLKQTAAAASKMNKSL